MTGPAATSPAGSSTRSGASPERFDDAAGRDELGPDAVELRLPPAAEYLRLARYAAADAATRSGLPIDAIDDVRLAVSELCTLLTGSGVPIALRFEGGPDGVVVSGRGAAGPQLAGEGGDLALTLVEAVVDEYHFEVHDPHAEFRIAKRRKV